MARTEHFDQAALEEERRRYELEKAITDAKAGRKDALQRAPRLKPEPQRLSAVYRIPLIGNVLSFFANLIWGREAARAVARRQRPVKRLPPGIYNVKFAPPRGKKFALAMAYAKRRFPGWPGKMSRGVFPGGLGKALKRRRPR
jgi:hypothetical protein